MDAVVPTLAPSTAGTITGLAVAGPATTMPAATTVAVQGVRERAEHVPSTARALAPLTLTRRGQVVALATLLVVAFSALSLGRVSDATTGIRPDTAVVYETLTVAPGQSLWGIARAAAPDSDPRATIARIVELNGLPTDGALRAGQQITVPVAR